MYICQIFQRFDQRPSSRWTIILNSHNPIITSSYTRRLVSYQVTHDDLYFIKLHTTICIVSSYTRRLVSYQVTHDDLYRIKLHTTTCIVSSYIRRFASYQVTHDELYRIKLHTTICIVSSYTRRFVSYQVTHDDLYRIKLHTTICRASSYTWWLGRIASSHIRLHDVRGIQIDWWIIADYLHSGQCKDENWRRNHVYQGAPTTRFGFKNVKQKHRNLARYLDVDYVTLFLKLWIFLCGVCYIISKVRDILM